MTDLPATLTRFAEPTYVLGDGIGGVTLMDVMGDDRAIAQAARTSYGDDGADYSDEGVRGLIRYLMSHRHSTPFETGCEVKIWVKLPIFVERQWARHRTAHWNEMSARYMQLPEEYYIPDPSIRPMRQSKSNKQGSRGSLPAGVAEGFIESLETTCADQWERYKAAVDADVAKEVARLLLPVNAYTVKVWKVDLHNLLHFLGLRLDGHAQWEIRQYANAIAEMVKVWCPKTWEAVEDYRIKAAMLSRMELAVTEYLIHRMADAPTREFARASDRIISICRECPEWQEMTKRERAGYLHRMGVIT